MPSMDFDALRAARKKAAPKEPFTAIIGGEQIRFAAEPSAAGVAEARAVIEAAEQQGDDSRAVVGVVGFLHSVVLSDDRDTFSRVLLDEDDPITMEDLAAIFLWVCSNYTPEEKAEPTPEKEGQRTTLDELVKIKQRAGGQVA